MSEKKTERRGLGRGLSALMADVDIATERNPTTAYSSVATEIAIELISPNPDQPRQDFSEDDLVDLANSIAERGIIQPLIVREISGSAGKFQIVAGERRWRAAQRAKLHTVPVVVREFTDSEVLEVAIIENVQRADLNAIEEALGYRQLQEKFGHTQEQLSSSLGKSRSHIANLLRLLNLPAEVLTWVRENKLSAGHARALVGSENAIELAKAIIAKGLSVRATEALVKKDSSKDDRPRPKATKRVIEKDADTKALEDDLSATLAMRVEITHKDGTESGALSISYKDFVQLDEICRRLAEVN